MTQRVTFFGSMDLDTELRYLDTESGNYPEAQDVHIGFSEGRGKMAVENIRGALKIVNQEVNEDGRYVCIGATPDRGSNILYFYLCDTKEGQHGIFRLLANKKTVEKVYVNKVLGFTPDNIIHSSDYIDGTLIWTDNNMPIGQLVVSEAMAGLYDSGLPDYIELARRQPANEITCTEPINSQKDFTTKRSFQFIYRYVFSNNQKSVWSIPSLLYNSGYDSVINAGVMLHISNRELSQADEFSKIITNIDIGFRESDKGIWKFYKRIPFPKTANSSITDIFLNDKAYFAISEMETSFLYHNVPLKSETIVVAENRAIAGGNTFGYETPLFQVTDVLRTKIQDPVLNKMYFNTGSRYGFCIFFYDKIGRCMGAVSLDSSSMGEEVSLAIDSRNGTYEPYKISFKLGGICPEWVAYYRIGITQSREKTAFLPAFVTVVSSSTNSLVFSADFATPTPSNYVWIYTDADPINGGYADRCAIKASNTSGGTIGSSFGNLPLNYDVSTRQYTITKIDTNLPTFSPGDIILVELFSPAKEGATEFFYEIPLSYYPILDNNNVRRYGVDYQNDKKTIEIGDGYGDTHYRKFTGNSGMSIGVECPSANDRYFQTWQHNIGRRWVVPLEKPQQKYDGRNMAFGDPYVQASNLNGLNSFNPSNQNWIPVELSNIKKLVQATDNQANGSVLLCITETDSISYYLEKIQFFSTVGIRTMGLSDQFLNKGNVLKNKAGTIHPESVHEFEGRVYWWDQNRGIYWRYSNDGLTNLGMNYNAKSYCNSISKKMAESKTICIGMYDPYFDESMIHLNAPNEQDNRILAFNESKNGFSAKYTFRPEWAYNIGQHLILFKNGELYMHHEGDTFNEVFGVKLKPKIGVVFNDDSKNNKRFLSLAFEAQDEWLPSIIKTHEVTKGQTQTTASAKVDKTVKDWDYWYEIRRVNKETNGLLDVRGKYLYVEAELQDDPQYLTMLYGVNCKNQDSNPLKERP